MRKLIAIWVLFFVPSLIFAALTFPAKPDGRVGDYAQLFTESQVLELNNKLLEVKEKTGYDFVVATVEDTQGTEISDYAVRLGNHWGVGQKGTNGGVLMLIDPKARKVFIATGYGAEIPLPDIQVKQIIENAIIPGFKSGDYFAGTFAGINEAQPYLAKEKIPVKEGNVRKASAKEDDSEVSFQDFFIIIIFVIVFIVGFSKRGLRRHSNPYGYRSNPGIFIGGSSSGSGGFGGGSFGGGFGGGSFGGGGASGSW